MAAGPDDDAAVRAQYERHPYPHRDPADEAERLIVGSPSHLLEIEHYVFAGRRAGDLRALVAGGGTGDGAIMLAQQLADRGAGTVTYLDISAASLAIARARAEARGLANMSFHQGSLLDAAALDAAPFDYIDCCGVLHHLAEPAEGLAALRAVLAPGGGMGLMFYGELGRTGVYPLQRALRRLTAGEDDGQKIALVRRVLAALPESNWFRRNDLLADHQGTDDAGLYDLLLHARDRAYIVPELFDLAAAAGLAITGFIEPVRYDPLTYLHDDDALRDRARALGFAERCALAEELCGNLKTHVFYVVRHDDPAAAGPDLGSAALTPALREYDPAEMARALGHSRNLNIDLDGAQVRLGLPDGATDIISLVDGRRSVTEIHRALVALHPRLDWPTFKARFDALYRSLQPLNMMLLGGPGAPIR